MIPAVNGNLRLSPIMLVRTLEGIALSMLLPDIHPTTERTEFTELKAAPFPCLQRIP